MTEEMRVARTGPIIIEILVGRETWGRPDPAEERESRPTGQAECTEERRVRQEMRKKSPLESLRPWPT